jgi:TPR repeat protein
MVQDTRLTLSGSSGEQITGAIDLDEGGSPFRRYRPPSSMPAKDGFAADDPVPLFLSGHADAHEPIERAWDRTARSPRILKAGILAASAAAIVLAALSVENPLALFANAKASLIGAAAGQTGPAPIRSAAVPPSADRAAGTARSAPTRDEIAAALRTAHQGQTEIRQPPAAAPPARRLDADELAALLKRAKSLIAIGDIAAARLLLERAADAQEASAALLLAQTYDPAVLGTPDARSITPDPATARDWYQKAARFGSPEARQRLAQMQN